MAISVVTLQESATWLAGVSFLTCHCSAGAGGKYRSMSKLGFLIDIRIAAGCFCCALNLDMSFIYPDVTCCLAFMGMQYAPCIAGQSVPFPSLPLRPHHNAHINHRYC